MTVLAPMGGVLVDRFPKVNVVRAGSALRGTLAIVLTVLVFTDSWSYGTCSRSPSPWERQQRCVCPV